MSITSWGLVSEPALGGHPGLRAPLRVVGPPPGQVQRPVDERVPAPGGVGEHGQHLAVLGLPGRPAVLRGHPHRLDPLLDHLGVVGDQHPVLGAQGGHHVVADPVTQRVGVPLGPAQQPLQPVGRPVPDVFGQLPGVLPRHIGQQPAHQIGERGPRLGPGEQRAGDPLGQQTKIRLPAHQVIVGDVIAHT